MGRFTFPIPVVLPALTLLVLTAGGLLPTATAQTPSFNPDAPLSSLRAAHLDTDQQRLQLATQLLDARAHTEISHAEYRDGVRFFRANHPTFYGNFFGDPFYATYDARYAKLVRARQRAETDVNPANSFWSPTSFYCAPVSYDPAFGGTCTGIAFAQSNFFWVPSFLLPRFTPSFVESAFPLWFSTAHGYNRALGDYRPQSANHVSRLPIGRSHSAPDAPHVDDLPTQLASINLTARPNAETPLEDHRPAETIQPPTHAPRQVQLPDDLHTTIQETAASLRQTELEIRLRREIREEYGGRQALSPRERIRLTRRLSRTVYSENEQLTDRRLGDHDSNVQVDRSAVRSRPISPPDVQGRRANTETSYRTVSRSPKDSPVTPDHSEDRTEKVGDEK